MSNPADLEPIPDEDREVWEKSMTEIIEGLQKLKAGVLTGEVKMASNSWLAYQECPETGTVAIAMQVWFKPAKPKVVH